LAKKNTDQLEKAARESNVRVDCQVKGVSRDASNKVIIAHLLKKRDSTAASFIGHFISHGTSSNS
jgi:hypothetical protein